MHEFIESHLRYLVADRLGVGDQELVPDVDLREDLAVDSLDLLELVLAVEAEFGIALPERVLDRVRRYGDLVEATVALVHLRLQAEQADDPPACITAHIVPTLSVRGAANAVDFYKRAFGATELMRVTSPDGGSFGFAEARSG